MKGIKEVVKLFDVTNLEAPLGKINLVFDNFSISPIINILCLLQFYTSESV